jgi:hypothetical protein
MAALTTTTWLPTGSDGALWSGKLTTSNCYTLVGSFDFDPVSASTEPNVQYSVVYPRR